MRCGIWSLTLREEHRLRVFVNLVHRKIFGPKRVEVTGEWRRLHNEKVYDLYLPTYLPTYLLNGAESILRS